jgi:hypothetical protein
MKVPLNSAVPVVVIVQVSAFMGVGAKIRQETAANSSKPRVEPGILSVDLYIRECPFLSRGLYCAFPGIKEYTTSRVRCVRVLAARRWSCATAFTSGRYAFQSTRRLFLFENMLRKHP